MIYLVRRKEFGEQKTSFIGIMVDIFDIMTLKTLLRNNIYCKPVANIFTYLVKVISILIIDLCYLIQFVDFVRSFTTTMY